MQIDSAAQSTWGAPIGAWDYTEDVTEVAFNDLGGYRELCLRFWGIQHDAGGTDTVIAQVGTESGWGVTGYSSIGNGTVTTAGITMQNTAQAASIVFNGVFYFREFNNADQETFMEGATGIPQGSGGVRAGTRGVAEVNDRLRITVNSGAANIAAGHVRLYGRR